jgi:invasion protein IalB
MTLNARLLLAGLLLAPINAAIAQTANSDGASRTQSIQTAETGWQVICRPHQADRSKLDCSIVYETFTTNDRVRVTAVEIVKGEKGRTVIVSVPVGVNLKDGLELMIDGANRQALTYASCQSNGCFATFDMDAKLIDTIRKGKNLSVGFSDGQGSKVKVDISLVGFNAAFLKSDDK